MTVNLIFARNFAKATQLIRSGDYEEARRIVRNNPESDQRIIARRIEDAKNANANRSNP